MVVVFGVYMCTSDDLLVLRSLRMPIRHSFSLCFAITFRLEKKKISCTRIFVQITSLLMLRFEKQMQ